MDVHAVYEWGHGSFVFEKGYEQIESSRKRYKDVHVLFTLRCRGSAVVSFDLWRTTLTEFIWLHSICVSLFPIVHQTNCDISLK
jgi:hypothetical protein